MTVPTQGLPTIGQVNSTEDPKIRNVLSELQAILSGNVDATNLAIAAVTSAKLAPTIGLTSTLLNTGSFNAYVDAFSLTFTPAVAARSLFIGAVMGTLNMGTNATQTANLKLVVDGVDQAFIPVVSATNSGTLTPSFPFTIAGVWIPTLSAGPHTVKTQLFGSNPGGASLTSGFLMRLELGS